MLPHERLEAALNARRLDLRVEWKDVAEAIDISPESLRAIRKGRNGARELTARAMDDWLGWEPGSVETLLSGGEPTPLSAAGHEDAGLDEQAPVDGDPHLLPPPQHGQVFGGDTPGSMRMLVLIDTRTGRVGMMPWADPAPTGEHLERLTERYFDLEDAKDAARSSASGRVS